MNTLHVKSACAGSANDPFNERYRTVKQHENDTINDMKNNTKTKQVTKCTFIKSAQVRIRCCWWNLVTNLSLPTDLKRLILHKRVSLLSTSDSTIEETR